MPDSEFEYQGRQPVEVRLAVMANELRNVREDLQEVKGTLTYIFRSLFGLVVTLIAGIMVFYFTQH